MVYGHWYKAFGHLAAGDMELAKEHSKRAIEVARDPFYCQFPKLALGPAYLLNGQLQEAHNVLNSCIKYCEKNGVGEVLTIVRYFLAPTLIAKGKMQVGKQIMDEARNTLKLRHRKIHYACSEYILGEIYLQIVTGPKPSLCVMAKNIGFLMKNVPSAGKKAEEHLCRASELFKKMKMKGYLGVAYLSLGSLYQAKRKTDQARQYILDSISIFKECEAHGYLNQANAALGSLK